MSFIRHPLTFILLLAGMVFMTASCATTGTCQSEYLPEDTAALLIYDDPLEPVNRSVQEINSGLEQYVVTPFSEVWRGITPSCVRTGISNFLGNMTFPLRALTHTLQGDWNYAWIDVKRFAVNTTVGVLGFRDPATAWGLPHIEGGFQYTFAKWGIPAGCYLNLPILGPGSVRDAAGKALNIPLDFASYFLPADANTVKLCLAFGNEATLDNPTRSAFFQGQYNHYEFTRLLFELAGSADFSGYRIDRSRQDYDADPSLGFLLFNPVDENFFYQGWQRKAQMPDGGEMPYTCWPKRGAKDVVVILPGLGGHRQSSGVSALAEIYRNAGCAVIAISSTFTPEYITAFPQVLPPGYFPADTPRLAAALRAVLDDHRNRDNGNREFRCHLVGYSLGAINLLHLAASEKDGRLLPGFRVDSYLAVNPPRDVMGAINTIDRFFNIPASWDAATRRERLNDTASRLACQLAPDFRNPPSPVIPLTRDESHFLIGLYLRSSLAAAIQAKEKAAPTGVLREDAGSFFHRNKLFAETLAFSFNDYMNRMVLPCYRAAGVNISPEEMARACSLDALAPSLRNNSRVRLLHNANDFLLKDGDAQWLKGVFGERAVIFEDGGHLGNMFLPAYRQLLVKQLLNNPEPETTNK